MEIFSIKQEIEVEVKQEFFEVNIIKQEEEITENEVQVKEEPSELLKRQLIVRLERCDYLINTKLKKHTNNGKEKLLYCCNQCQYKSNKKANLHNHVLSTHSEHQLYNCDKCDYTTNIKRYFERHQLIHEDVKPFACDKCTFRTVHKISLKKHQMIHNKNKEFNCDQCDYKTHLKRNFIRHKSNHTGDKLYSCNRCDFKTNFWESLQVHQYSTTACQRNNTSSEQNTDKIQQLTPTDSSETNDEAHRLTHSDDANVDVNPLQTYKGHYRLYSCDHCDYKTRIYISFKEHKLVHIGEKQYACDQCDYRTHLKKYLTPHRLTHVISQIDKPYKCDQCDYSANFTKYLKKHQMKHNDSKLFSCNQCSFKTNFKEYFKKHQLIHDTSVDINPAKHKSEDVEAEIHHDIIKAEDTHVKIKEEPELTIIDYIQCKNEN